MRLFSLILIVFTLGLSGCGGSGKSEVNAQVKTQEIVIDHRKYECKGEGTYLCMPSRSPEDKEWTSGHIAIDGFDYEWGYTYTLRVRKLELDPLLQDDLIYYELVEILNKEPVDHETTFELGLFFASALVSEGVEAIVKKSEYVYTLYFDKSFTCTPEQCETIDSLLEQKMAMLLELKHSSKPMEPLELVQIKCSAPQASFYTDCRLH